MASPRLPTEYCLWNTYPRYSGQPRLPSSPTCQIKVQGVQIDMEIIKFIKVQGVKMILKLSDQGTGCQLVKVKC